MKLRVGFGDKDGAAYIIRDGKIDCVGGSPAERESLQLRLEMYLNSMVMDYGIPEADITPESTLRWIVANRNGVELSEDTAPVNP